MWVPLPHKKKLLDPYKCFKMQSGPYNFLEKAISPSHGRPPAVMLAGQQSWHNHGAPFHCLSTSSMRKVRMNGSIAMEERIHGGLLLELAARATRSRDPPSRAVATGVGPAMRRSASGQWRHGSKL